MLDADSPDAEAHLLSLLPKTRTVRTARGKHFYLTSTASFKNTVGRLSEHVDVRSGGGYIVAPPSVHENGTIYRWDDDTVPIASLPPEVERQLLEKNQSVPAARRILAIEDEIPEGRRNDSLTKIAGEIARRAVSAGFGCGEVRVLLRYSNETRCKPPLPTEEVDAIATRIFEAQAKKAPRSVQLLTRREIDFLPDPEYLIEGVLVKNSLSILYGDPGAAKTFLALDMAIAVATGRPWCQRAVSPAPVVYVCAEGVSGIKRRIGANELRHGVHASQLYCVGAAVQLNQPAAVTALIARLHEGNVRPGLVVFDTLSRCAVGVDENAAKDMSVVVAGLDRIKEEFGATVLVIHHSKKAERSTIRGSSAILGAVDTALLLVRNSDNQRVLTMEKQKDGEPAPPLTFRLEQECGSAVPVWMDAPNRGPKLSDKEQTALGALDSLGTATSGSWSKASGLTLATYKRSRTRLIACGLVTKGGDGRYRRALSSLATIESG